VFDLFKVKRKKLFFSLIAVAICAVLVGGTMTALTFSSTPKTTIELQTPLPQGCISADQAIQIAKNYTNQYARENNRTIAEIKAVFGYSSIRDTFFDQFDSYPLESDYPKENGTYSVWNATGPFCLWNVTATFQETTHNNVISDGQPVLQYSVPSYLVSVYGYSGQIKSQGPIITVNQQGLYNNLQVAVVVNQEKGLFLENYVSAEQAFQMSIPYINQYVTENNRTVIKIIAGFSMVPDFLNKRGDNMNALYPVWQVDAFFDGTIVTNPNAWPWPENYFKIGYSVGIWADTAQIKWHQIDEAI
jgi:hypothetical protein